jgi:hypothetical protein
MARVNTMSMNLSPIDIFSSSLIYVGVCYLRFWGVSCLVSCISFYISRHWFKRCFGDGRATLIFTGKTLI